MCLECFIMACAKIYIELVLRSLAVVTNCQKSVRATLRSQAIARYDGSTATCWPFIAALWSLILILVY